MTAVNRCKHLLTGSRNSHVISVDIIIYIAGFLGGGGGENETVDKTVQQCTVSLLRAEIALRVDLLPDQNRSTFHVVRTTRNSRHRMKTELSV